MEKSIIEAKVIALATDILGSPVTIASSMENTPQWDSLKHMELIFAFEDAFSVRLDEGELIKLRSIESLVNRVAARR